MKKGMLTIVAVCIGAFFFTFTYICLDIGEKRGYNKGYEIGFNEAEYKVSIQCGEALHKVILSDCSELYKMLVEDRPTTFTDELIRKEKAKKELLEAVKSNKGENSL